MYHYETTRPPKRAIKRVGEADVEYLGGRSGQSLRTPFVEQRDGSYDRFGHAFDVAMSDF
jgi:hypothetical protein